MCIWNLCQLLNGYLGSRKTAGNHTTLQMLPFRWSPATGSADERVEDIEARAIFLGSSGLCWHSIFFKVLSTHLKRL